MQSKFDTRKIEILDMVSARLSDYKIGEWEIFSDLQIGVLSSTHVDTQGDRMTIEDLEHMRDAINNGVIWLQYEHEILMLPIGRNLYAETVIHEHHTYLIAVMGYYSEEVYKDPSSVKRPENYHLEINIPISDEPKDRYIVQVGYDRHIVDSDLIDEVLKSAPPWVSRDTMILQQKSETANTVLISLSIAIPLLVGKSFLDGMAKELGKNKAQWVTKWMDWFIDEMLPKVVKNRATLVLNTNYKKIPIKLVVPNGRKKTIEEAYMKAHEAASLAIAICKEWTDSGVDILEIIWKYDVQEKSWDIHQVRTRTHGILSSPANIAALKNFNLKSAKALSMSRLINRKLLEKEDKTKAEPDNN